MTHGKVSRAVSRLLRPFHRHDKADDAFPKRQRGCMASLTTSSCSTVSSSSRSSSGARGAAAARVFKLKSDADGIPHTVMMPSAFFRQMRALVEQTMTLTTGDQMRASHKDPESSFSSSRSSIRWRGQFSTRTLDRLAVIFTEDDADGFANTISRRSAKPVPLETAVKAMLRVWKCCIQILEVLADGAAPEPSLRYTMAHSKDVAAAAANEKRRQLEQAALTLLVLVVRRQEFDALLVAVGHGGCVSHKPTEEARHGIARLSRRRSRSSCRSRGVSTPAKSGNRASRASSMHQAKNGKRAQDHSFKLCDSVHRLLEMHQSTLQYAFETVHGPVDCSGSNTTFCALDQNQELLSALVATSYLRVPRLRSRILDNLSNLLPSSTFSSSSSFSHSTYNSRGRGKSVSDDKLRLTPYNWHHSMYPQCQNLLATINREDRWTPSAQILNHLMADMDGCMLALAHIYEQLTGQQVSGRTDWKCVPGSDILKDATLEVVKNLFLTELQQREPKWQDDAEEKVDSETASASEKNAMPSRDSMSLTDGYLDEVNAPAAHFAVQVTSMMNENHGFIHEYLMTILRSTNYMLPHHVSLCLQYLEKLVTEFPVFFASDPVTQNLPTMDTSNSLNQSQHEHSCADVETLRFVFSCLLDSEHFEILKATELFLLKNFMKFSVTLQLQLTDLFASHLKRLFLHWNRDVRYCYYHILLYLTYSGNRLVLGAKSDEVLMGSKASRLFEIPGLVRTEGTANWDAFDIPLQQIVARYTQMTKNKPRATQSPTWVDAINDSIVQCAVSEYKTHVMTYFHYAQQISMHQRVPIPSFSVKSGENISFPADADGSRAAAVLA